MADGFTWNVLSVLVMFHVERYSLYVSRGTLSPIIYVSRVTSLTFFKEIFFVFYAFI